MNNENHENNNDNNQVLGVDSGDYILSIDDDREFNQSLERLLEKLHLEVVTTETEEIFFKTLNVRRPRVCLLDLNMGGYYGAGLEVVKKIKASSFADLPLIAVSRVSDKEYIRKVMASGTSDYITKPLDLSVLAEKLKHFFTIDEKLYQQFLLFPLGDGLSFCQLSIDSEWHSVTEEGVWVDVPHFLASKTLVKIDHPLLRKITTVSKPLVCSVSSMQRKEEGGFRAFLSFDPLDLELHRRVRYWIYNQRFH